VDVNSDWRFVMKFRIIEYVKPDRTWYQVEINRPLFFWKNRWVKLEFGCGDYSHTASFDSRKEAADYIIRTFTPPTVYITDEIEI